ncbi:MAG: hypothetical protein KDA17_03440 [Candidatus Saccharibacteria bacterium]|nr:hypothetical protein [Candidatus Saccharibacteria bacterium]MCA9339938.1 hypothetical protein [Candidatus Saccharibacteria bacterium]
MDTIYRRALESPSGSLPTVPFARNTSPREMSREHADDIAEAMRRTSVDIPPDIVQGVISTNLHRRIYESSQTFTETDLGRLSQAETVQYAQVSQRELGEMSAVERSALFTQNKYMRAYEVFARFTLDGYGFRDLGFAMSALRLFSARNYLSVEQDIEFHVPKVTRVIAHPMGRFAVVSAKASIGKIADEARSDVVTLKSRQAGVIALDEVDDRHTANLLAVLGTLPAAQDSRGTIHDLRAEVDQAIRYNGVQVHPIVESLYLSRQAPGEDERSSER